MKIQYAVSAIIIEKNKMFTVREKDEKGNNVISFPKVYRKLGMSPEESIKSYLLDKYSVSIEVYEWVGSTKRDDTKLQIINQAYLCKIVDGHIDNSTAVEWISYSIFMKNKCNPEYKELFYLCGWRLDYFIDKIKEHSYKEKKDDLIKEIYDTTKTVTLLNTFEGVDKSHGPYKRLVFKNSYQAYDDKYDIRYRFIIERYPDIDNTVGNITFSEFLHNSILSFKKIYKAWEVFMFCERELRIAISQSKHKKIDSNEFYFDKPYRLRAQYRVNREFEKFGSTEDYAFVGVVIEAAEKRKNKIDYNDNNAISKSQKTVKKELQVDIIRIKEGRFFKIYKSGNDRGYLIPYMIGMTEEEVIKEFKSKTSGGLEGKKKVTRHYSNGDYSFL